MIALESCHACEELIKSETILAGPHHYHQHCFTCAHCNQALGDNFYCVDNRNYCPQHKEVGTRDNGTGLVRSGDNQSVHCAVLPE